MSERLIITTFAPTSAEKKDCDVEIKVGDAVVWRGSMSEWSRALSWTQRVLPKPLPAA